MKSSQARVRLANFSDGHMHEEMVGVIDRPSISPPVKGRYTLRGKTFSIHFHVRRLRSHTGHTEGLDHGAKERCVQTEFPTPSMVFVLASQTPRYPSLVQQCNPCIDPENIFTAERRHTALDQFTRFQPPPTKQLETASLLRSTHIKPSSRNVQLRSSLAA